ncbi:MAG: flagellar biosynthetic protein FliO [Sphingomonadaceae bacterium]
MLAEFLVRLAITLPLVCGLAALLLMAVKRGWLPLPGFMRDGLKPAHTGPATMEPLELLSTKMLAPGTRVAVVRFGGRQLLLGIGAQGPVLLADSGPTVTDGEKVDG